MRINFYLEYVNRGGEAINNENQTFSSPFQVKKMKATNPARDAKFSQEANMVVSGKLSIGKLPQPQMLHIEFSKDGPGFSSFY